MHTLYYRRWLSALALAFGIMLFGVGSSTVFAQATDANADESEATEVVEAQVLEAEGVEAEPGVLIVAVVPDSPAAAAGLSRGDIVLAINGQPVSSVDALANAIYSAEVGATVEVTYLHGDEERTVEVTLGEQAGVPFLGIRPYADMTAIATRVEAPGVFSVQSSGFNEIIPGIVIEEVVPDSPAAEAGLMVGDMITAVNGTPLGVGVDLTEIIAEYAPGDEVTLDLLRGGPEGGSEQVVVTLGTHPDDEERPYIGVVVAPRTMMITTEVRKAVPLEAPPMPYPGQPVWPMPYPGYAVPYPYMFVYPMPLCPCGSMMPQNHFYYYGAPVVPGQQVDPGAIWFHSVPQVAPAVPVMPEKIQSTDVLLWKGTPMPGMAGEAKVVQLRRIGEAADPFFLHVAPPIGVESNAAARQIRMFTIQPGVPVMEGIELRKVVPSVEAAPVAGLEL